jgi:hypothetical protein
LRESFRCLFYAHKTSHFSDQRFFLAHAPPSFAVNKD